MIRPEIVHRAASSLVRIAEEATRLGLGPPDVSAVWWLENRGATTAELRAALAIAQDEFEEKITDLAMGIALP